jgi:acetyl-CoA synthetase
MTVSDYTWYPTEGGIAAANVTRLVERFGAAGIDELRRTSVSDVGAFWDAVVDDLGIEFSTPYSCVLDLTRGIEWPDWFVDGRINVVDACLTRWAAAPAARGRAAVLHESEDGVVRSLTFGELADEVGRAAAGLRRLGVREGDAVALFLPMIPEAVAAFYAVVSLGAVAIPLFSGFAPSAIASRIQDGEAVAVITAASTIRRGKAVNLLPHMLEAIADCPTVRDVVAVGGESTTKDAGPRVLSWTDLVAAGADGIAPVDLDASATLLLAYTSGTTGRPKGAVHTHAGFLLKTASEVAYSFDVKEGDVFSWVTDMGWIMGPLSIVGTHANGAALMLYEGSPDVPDVSRLWELVQRHGITMLGVSPTLARALRAGLGRPSSEFELSSVRTLGSTGEPWDPDSYEWLARDVFGSRVPVINFSGGTEVGGSFLAPYPVEPIPSCSLGGPSLGMDVDVVDDDAQPVRGVVGELVCRQPWPSMTRGVWKDDERYLEAYWSTFPGVWRHGDYALADSDGQWFILGRSDDVMNVAGKRLAPAEVEAVLAGHPAVAESAVVGVPDSTKGESVWAFWVPRAGVDDDVSAELRSMVGAALGKPFTPKSVLRVTRLPKTISGKIVRRAVRAAVTGDDPGDLSGMESGDAVDEIRSLVRPDEA